MKLQFPQSLEAGTAEVITLDWMISNTHDLFVHFNSNLYTLIK